MGTQAIRKHTCNKILIRNLRPKSNRSQVIYFVTEFIWILSHYYATASQILIIIHNLFIGPIRDNII